MSDELNPAIIKRTQNILGKYVKKPSLTEKLLRKPPFRFLHDVFAVVIRDTQCFVGLYSAEELTYENIKDRDDKMKFLQKMIDVVKLTTGSPLAVKSSKIVAGHEPEKTNELLQLMGEIIEQKLEWQTAVEQVRSGKAARKGSPKKSKGITNKAIKHTKPKESPKEKDPKAKDAKTTKTHGDKMATTMSKDENLKLTKTKDATSLKLATKERTLKGSKAIDKPLKKPVKEATSNANEKLIKSDSQSSNKTVTAPNTLEKEKKINESERNQEEIQPQKENSTTITPARTLSPNSGNNIYPNGKDLSPIKNFEVGGSSMEKSKRSSAKSRKSSADKPVDVFGEHIDKEQENNLQKAAGKSLIPSQEMSEITEDRVVSTSKEQSFVSSVTNEQQAEKISEPISLDKAQRERVRSSSQTSSAAAVNSSNEMKRESTFTRENSKDSNNSTFGNRSRTSLRPPSARPPSARPGAPRRRDKNIEIILQPNDQVKMSGIQVKLETFGDLDDDGENLVIIENPNVNDVAIVEQTNLTKSDIVMPDDALEQGHLVQQILETQKELVQPQNDAESQQKADKESANNSVMRQTSALYMNNLRDVIQNLTKSVNPLGKLMDFIPEDMDAMQLEFTLWRDSYIQAANELKREKSLTESATEPLKNQLLQIEENIVEYTEMINANRVKVLQNSEKIIKMLTTFTEHDSIVR